MNKKTKTGKGIGTVAGRVLCAWESTVAARVHLSKQFLCRKKFKNVKKLSYIWYSNIF